MTQKRIRLRSEAGFTLIEVLVVTLIVGILAAIAIPVFMGQREKAVEASLKADLRNYALYESAFGTETGVYGTRSEVDVWAEDVHLSSGNTLQVVSGAGTSTGFCLRATDITTTLTWFYNSMTGGLMAKGEYCGEPLAPPEGTPDNGCKGSGYGGPGNNWCPGSNGNGGGGVGGGNGKP